MQLAWFSKQGRCDARPGDFKDAQKPGASEYADADRVHEVLVDQRRLDPAADDDEEVEPVEHGAEVALEPDRVHLDEHLNRKQRHEEHVRHVCNEQTYVHVEAIL